MKKLGMLAAAAALMFAANGALAQSKVMVGEPSWPGAKIMANIIGQIITGRLGGEAGYSPGANAVIFACDGRRPGRHRRASGRVAPQPESPLPMNMSTKREPSLFPRVPTKDAAASAAPTYMAEEHGIKSVFDLGTPAAQELFDADGDGMGEIWVGASGWASTNVHRVKVRDYGIEAFLDPCHGGRDRLLRPVEGSDHGEERVSCSTATSRTTCMPSTMS